MAADQRAGELLEEGLPEGAWGIHGTFQQCLWEAPEVVCWVTWVQGPAGGSLVGEADLGRGVDLVHFA